MPISRRARAPGRRVSASSHCRCICKWTPETWAASATCSERSRRSNNPLPKRPLPPITSANVRLRLIGQSDLATTRAWRNQDDIRKWFLTSSVISPEQHESWFAQYRDRDDDFVFIIEETETLCRPVGQVSIYGIDW